MYECAIYCIEHRRSGKKYVGSTNDVTTRWSLHRGQLRDNKHHSILLQRAWNKYGSDAFTFRVLERCSAEEMLDREQAWIDGLDACNPRRGYNINPVAASSLGVKRRPETRKKQSEKKKAFYAAGGEVWNKGVPWPEDVRRKLRDANVGKTYTDEVNLKKGSGWRGKKRGPMSAEQRAKVSASKRGVTPNIAPERWKDIQAKRWAARREAGTDRHTEATKRRISEAKRGVPNPKKRRVVLYQGRETTFQELSERSGVPVANLRFRMKAGWPEDKLLISGDEAKAYKAQRISEARTASVA